MSGIWGAFDNQDEEVKDPGSFGGVTATDFFGLLLVAMFVLTLLAALTLGVRGQFDQTDTSDLVGGRNTSTSGIESASTYRQLTVDMWTMDEDGDVNHQTADNTLTVNDALIPASGTAISPHQVLNPENSFIRFGVSATWSSLDSDEFATATKYDISAPIPPRNANADAGVSGVSEKLGQLLSDQSPESRNSVRELLYLWGEGYAERVGTQFLVLPEQEVLAGMKSLAILRLKWNFQGDRQTRYLVCERAATVTTKSLTVAFDSSKGTVVLYE